MKENVRLQVKRQRSLERLENEEQFKENVRLQVNRFNAKKRSENVEQFKENSRLRLKRHRTHERLDNEEKFKENVRSQVKRHRDNKKENWGRMDRLIKFRNAVKFGAIFVCISCQQRLFENGVSAVTNNFKEFVESKKPGLYSECVIEIEQKING